MVWWVGNRRVKSVPRHVLGLSRRGHRHRRWLLRLQWGVVEDREVGGEPKQQKGEIRR